MKHLKILLLYCLLLQNINLFSSENQPKASLSLAFYNAYFIAKELCKVCIYTIYLGTENIEKGKICCVQCNHIMQATMIWGYCSTSMNQPIIDKMISLMYHGTAKELSEFLASAAHELQIECPYCKTINWQTTAQEL